MTQFILLYSVARARILLTNLSRNGTMAANAGHVFYFYGAKTLKPALITEEFAEKALTMKHET